MSRNEKMSCYSDSEQNDSVFINSSKHNSQESYYNQHNQNFKKFKNIPMIYIFKRYERLQNQCNIYKNKLYKMRLELDSNEKKENYMNLLLEKQNLKFQLDQKRKISWKYYISLSINLALGIGLFYSYWNS